MKRRTLLAASAVALASPALAQDADYPSRPIRILVPLVPGGQTDFIARLVAQQMSRDWNQPVVVENRAGANGQIAIETVARAPADGYTLLVGNVATNAIGEAVYPDRRVKPSRDLVGITCFLEVPQVIAVSKAFPAQTMQQFIAHARDNPGRVTYGSAGVGSFSHLAGEILGRIFNVDLLHVPYRGAGDTTRALLGGEVSMSVVTVPPTLAALRNGDLRGLALLMPQRLAALPDVPAAPEAGVAEISGSTKHWHGLFSPIGLPTPIRDRLFAKSVEVMRRPEVRDILASQLTVPAVSESPAAFQAFLLAERDRWTNLISEYRITAHE